MINQPKTLNEEIERIQKLMSINEFVSMSSDEQVGTDVTGQLKDPNATSTTVPGQSNPPANPNTTSKPTEMDPNQTLKSDNSVPAQQSLSLKDYLNKPISAVKDELVDGTAVFNSQGYYGKGQSKPSAAPSPAPVSEGFDMSLFYVNPLLFESVINEQTVQATAGNKYMVSKTNGNVYRVNGSGNISAIFQNNNGTYTCIGDCYNQTNMSSRFTKTAQAAKDGKSLPPYKPTQKAAPSQVNSGQAKVVTDKDLVGETGLIQNTLHSGTMGATLNIAGIHRHGVKGVVDALDGIVTSNDLRYVQATLDGMKNWFYFNPNKKVYEPAIIRFSELYSEDEGGDNLLADVRSVSTATDDTVKLKQDIERNIFSQIKTPVPQGLKVPAQPTTSQPAAKPTTQVRPSGTGSVERT